MMMAKRVAFGVLLATSFNLSLGTQEYDSYGSYWAQPQVNQISTEIQDYSPNYQTTSPNLRQDIIDFCVAIGLVPSQTLLTGAGVLGNAALTLVKSATLKNSIEDTSRRVDQVATRVSSLEASSSTVCSRLRSLLNTPDPMFSTSAPATPPNGVSQFIGQKTGTSYPILSPLASASDKALTLRPTGDEGLDLTIPTTQLGMTNSLDTALSIADFNFFRLQSIAALDALDGKIRQILSVTAPTCS